MFFCLELMTSGPTAFILSIRGTVLYGIYKLHTNKNTTTIISSTLLLYGVRCTSTDGTYYYLCALERVELLESGWGLLWCNGRGDSDAAAAASAAALFP